MIVLGIETASRWGGAALAGEEGLIGCFEVEHGGRTEHFHSIVSRLCRETGVGRRSIGGVAVSTGPGSFTGLRIGLGAAKGIALAGGAPIVGVPLLPLLFERAALWSGGVAAWIDAGRREVYGTCRDGQGDEEAPSTLPVAEQLARVGRGEVLFIGSGARRYEETIVAALGERAVIAPAHRCEPSAAEVALRGYDLLRRGSGDPLDDLEPIYLRGADAKLPGGGER